MTGGKFKNYSHIWDNVMTSTTPTHLEHQHHQHQVHAAAVQDSTGSSLTLVEHSRSEITLIEPAYSNPNRVKTQPPVRKYPAYPPVVQKPVEKSKKAKHSAKPGFCTNRDRELAEQPKTANTWKFQKESKEKYDGSTVSVAFDEYAHRLTAKKMRLEQEKKSAEQQKAKKRVTVKECRVETCKEETKFMKTKPKVEILNRRDDDIVIDAVSKKVVVLDSEDVEQVQKTCAAGPVFYGTIEAEVSAEKASQAMATANENLERLQFVAGAVYPEVEHHLKKLDEINNDVKDFGVQQRANRTRVPTSVNCSQVAHFVIAEGFE